MLLWVRYRFLHTLAPVAPVEVEVVKRKRDARAPQAIMLLYENSSTHITYLTLTPYLLYLHYP